MKAPLLLPMGAFAALFSSGARAGPWSVEPRLGIAAQYVSNPQLLITDPQAEENLAATADLPLRYDTDSMEFLLRPNGRLTNRQGYSSLASNYEHLDAAAQIPSEKGMTTLQGEVARDSSLYYVGGLVNGIGVPRDSANINANWTHSLTERQQVQLDASWTRVRYVEPAGFNALVDYRYLSAGPTFSAAISERNTLKILGSYGRYQSLNGITESRSENLQLAFVRQLSEILTLSTSAGYSRSVNSQKVYESFFFGTVYLGEFKSDQNGAVYAASLTRQGQRCSLSVGASQALQPTGFAFLSRQETVNVNTTYVRTERWDFAGTASWLRAVNPLVSGGVALKDSQSTTRYLNAQLTANWHWTPQWTVSASAARITQEYGSYTVAQGTSAVTLPSKGAASTNVSLNFARQFLRTQF